MGMLQHGRGRFRRQPELRRVADWLTVEFAASKLRRPVVRPDSVRRLALIDRLTQGRSFPVMSVVAPAGYGKTTLLAQWAERNGQAFAWVSLDERDNDPKVLLTYVAEALDAVEPISKQVFDALASPGSSVPGSVVPRLGAALASMTAPVALVLDDVHVLHDQECRAAMPVLADHVPSGSQLVLAGRDAPPLSIARLRAEGKVMEIGPGDLALTLTEASSLLRAAGIMLGQDDMAELHRRTEGWQAGLYLAALSLREGGSLGTSVASFNGRAPAGQPVHAVGVPGADLPAAAGVPDPDRGAGAAVRPAVRGGARPARGRRHAGGCGAVEPAAGAAGLARRVVPLPSAVPRHAAGRTAPPGAGADPVLRRRAAGWCLANGLPEEALEYSIAAGDVDAAARLVGGVAVPAYRQGRITTLQRWFRWLDERGGIEGHPMAAVLASLLAALTARPADAERWADAVDRWQYADTALPADPPPRRGRPCSGPLCADAGSSRCGPTPTRPRASSQS